MSTRVIFVILEIDDDESQGDEVEMLMGEIEGVVNDYNRDPCIKRTVVKENDKINTVLSAIMDKSWLS